LLKSQSIKASYDKLAQSHNQSIEIKVEQPLSKKVVRRVEKMPEPEPEPEPVIEEPEPIVEPEPVVEPVPVQDPAELESIRYLGPIGQLSEQMYDINMQYFDEKSSLYPQMKQLFSLERYAIKQKLGECLLHVYWLHHNIRVNVKHRHRKISPAPRVLGLKSKFDESLLADWARAWILKENTGKD
jgi:hypothetical protein